MARVIVCIQGVSLLACLRKGNSAIWLILAALPGEAVRVCENPPPSRGSGFRVSRCLWLSLSQTSTKPSPKDTQEHTKGNQGG